MTASRFWFTIPTPAMTGRKKARNEAQRELRDTERDQEIESLPARIDVLQRVIASVEALVEGGRACDHTLKTTRECAEEFGLDWPSVALWLRDHGGYCDCEVVLNSSQHCAEIALWIEERSRRN